jgi:hypothetical protein
MTFVFEGEDLVEGMPAVEPEEGAAGEVEGEVDSEEVEGAVEAPMADEE